MEEAKIIAARDKAMRAVAGMPDNEFRLKAFEVILAKLLETEAQSTGDSSPLANSSPKFAKTVQSSAAAEARRTPSSCSERVLSLRDEGFFKGPRTLGEVRNELQMHGWTYPITSLSGPVQKLVQKRELRRMAGQDKNSGSYTYVAP